MEISTQCDENELEPVHYGHDDMSEDSELSIGSWTILPSPNSNLHSGHSSNQHFQQQHTTKSPTLTMSFSKSVTVDPNVTDADQELLFDEAGYPLYSNNESRVAGTIIQLLLMALYRELKCERAVHV